jgi:hypothetical protein
MITTNIAGVNIYACKDRDHGIFLIGPLGDHAERWLMATASGTMDSGLLAASGVSSCVLAAKPT